MERVAAVTDRGGGGASGGGGVAGAGGSVKVLD